MFVHNFYQQSGGEDKVLQNEMELLSSNGIKVSLYSVNNEIIKDKSLGEKIKLGIDTIWSYTEYKKIKNILISFQPDVVHIHNFFPLLSPSIYFACNSMNIPVVQTLHNYRLLCPAATFMKDQKVCEKCLHGSLINSVVNGCYRNSISNTIPLAAMIKINRVLGTWNNKVTRYIALTNFAKGKFEEGGISSDKLVVKPNFIREQVPDKEIYKQKEYLLFVGRISVEKGVLNLLKAWSYLKDNSTDLVIIGDGPEKEALEKLYNLPNVKFLGNLDSKNVLSYMRNAKFLVVPSLWYEGFPMTIIESYSVGTPVICSKLGSLEEVVKNEITGFHFKPENPDDIASIIDKALTYKSYKKLRLNVRAEYKEKYTSEVNFNILKNIYDKLIEEKKNA